MAPQPLNIVLTNDDGYNAPGIQTLYAALVAAGNTVHIVAPAVNQSAQGSSLGGVAALSSPIAVTQFSAGNFYVDGRPATAALVGLDDLFGGATPDLVISGTNRGDNIGESENISGTVNDALQGLFEGVPAIAVSAGSANGSYTAGFANAASFVVDLVAKLAQARTPGSPLLPAGEGLSVNVPGTASPASVAVTTITPESSASFPYQKQGDGTYAEGFTTNTAASGDPLSEGSQFLNNHLTVSPIDGNWGSSQADRDSLAARLGTSLSQPSVGLATKALNILLIDEDGYGSAGITAARQALLAKGYNVTVLAPSTDQSGVGSALFLNPISVTTYDAKDYAATGTPASLVALGLDPQGLLAGLPKPDLVVSGIDTGDAVGIENANHSATLAGAVTALFNYGVPSIAVNSKSGLAADVATSADVLTRVIANLQATQGTATSILPAGVGLSINVPTGASASNYAYTVIDGATDANLAVTGDATSATFTTTGVVTSGNPLSEGTAFNAGKITISTIDGNFTSRDAATTTFLANLLGAPQYGNGFAVDGSLGPQIFVGTGNPNFIDTAAAAGTGQVLVDLAAGTAAKGGNADATFSNIQGVQLGADASVVLGLETGTDILYDGSGTDSFYGKGATDIIQGGSGINDIVGGTGNAIFYSGGGTDVMRGGTAANFMAGGTPADKTDAFYGNGGQDYVYGHGSAMILVGAGGGEYLTGGSGLNELIGARQADAGGNKGFNVLLGGSGTDVFYAGIGTNLLYEGSGTDALTGSSGLDVIYGGSGRSFIHGGSGTDVITSGAGNQYIQAGTGTTVFNDTAAHLTAGRFDQIDNFKGAQADGTGTFLFLSTAAQSETSFVNQNGNTAILTTVGGGTAEILVSNTAVDIVKAQTHFTL